MTRTYITSYIKHFNYEKITFKLRKTTTIVQWIYD